MHKEAAVPLNDSARELTDYFRFVDEDEIKDTITRSTSFATEFAEQGPRDKKGRSLRHLDLSRRLMRYPCSYMIYCAEFRGRSPNSTPRLPPSQSQLGRIDR